MHFGKKSTLTFGEKTLAESRQEDDGGWRMSWQIVFIIGATSGCGVGTFASVNISGPSLTLHL